MPDSTPSLPPDHNDNRRPAGQYRPPHTGEGMERRPPQTTPSAAPPARPLPTPSTPELDHLLAEIHVRLRQQQYNEVKERLARAKEMAPEHPAVLEIEGDLAAAQRRYKQAETLYKAAFQADPGNARLEEKFATAVIKVHAPDYVSINSIPDDAESFWSNRIARPPVLSAILSAIIPGLGQFYNGDWLKGAILVLVDLGILSRILYAVYATLSVLKTQGAVPLDMVMQNIYRSISIPMLLLMAAAWAYSIADAAMTARAMQQKKLP